MPGVNQGMRTDGDVAKRLRRRIANPLFVGSNPTVASKTHRTFRGQTVVRTQMGTCICNVRKITSASLSSSRDAGPPNDEGRIGERSS